MRRTIYSLLTTDTILNGLGITAETVWNVEAPESPGRTTPFLVLAYNDDPPVFGRPARRGLAVWAHDEPNGDYSRIDEILERVRILLGDIVHQGGITQVDWEGASPDLFDDGFHTITRNSGFRVIGAGRSESNG